MNFEKFSSENFLEKFQKNLGLSYFTRGTSSQKWGPKGHQGPTWGTPRGQIPWPRGTHHFDPQVELGEQPVPISSPSTENHLQVFFPNFPELPLPAIFDLPSLSRFFKSVWWNYSLVCDSSAHPITFCSYALFMKYFAALDVT